MNVDAASARKAPATFRRRNKFGGVDRLGNKAPCHVDGFATFKWLVGGSWGGGVQGCLKKGKKNNNNKKKKNTL